MRKRLFDLWAVAAPSFDIKQANARNEKIALLELDPATESARYQDIPKTQMSVRFDKGNTHTLTQDHAHIFASPKGKGKDLYSVNKDGTG